MARKKKEKEFEEVIHQEEVIEEIQEEVDPDPEIYEDGPRESVVDAWKELYGKVYLIEFEPGEVFIFRPLSRREFKELTKADGGDALYKEERLCEECVVWPLDYDFMAINAGKAGIPTLLSEEIMLKSGFKPTMGSIEL